MLSVEPSVGREWNHELAGFRHPETGRSPSAERSGSTLEPSHGRDCGIGSIQWPRPRDDKSLD